MGSIYTRGWLEWTLAQQGNLVVSASSEFCGKRENQGFAVPPAPVPHKHATSTHAYIRMHMIAVLSYLYAFRRSLWCFRTTERTTQTLTISVFPRCLQAWVCQKCGLGSAFQDFAAVFVIRVAPMIRSESKPGPGLSRTPIYCMRQLVCACETRHDVSCCVDHSVNLHTTYKGIVISAAQ